MTPEQERAPMQGLASFLRALASDERLPMTARDGLRAWAAEVEQARAQMAQAAPRYTCPWNCGWTGSDNHAEWMAHHCAAQPTEALPKTLADMAVRFQAAGALHPALADKVFTQPADPLTGTILQSTYHAAQPAEAQELAEEPGGKSQRPAWLPEPRTDAAEDARRRRELLAKIKAAELYTAPPARQPLTDGEIRAMWLQCAPDIGGIFDFARLIQAAHGIKGEQHE